MEKIIDRIRKLLELAGNNPNENEALSAMEMATRLMAEHNIEMATVEAEKNKDSDPAVEQEFKSAEFRHKWGRVVWGAVARLNFCKYYYRSYRDQNDRNFLVGTQANIAATKVMVDYLIATIDRLSHGAPIPGSQRRAFCLGAAGRVSERLNELLRQRKKGEAKPVVGGGTNLPALASLYGQHEEKNDKALARIHPGMKFTKAASSTTQNWSAFSRGRAAGDTISLTQQVGRGSQRMLGR
jgi:Protein of unknown function (DUF2786)